VAVCYQWAIWNQVTDILGNEEQDQAERPKQFQLVSVNKDTRIYEENERACQA
jgi:hypothetical protein